MIGSLMTQRKVQCGVVKVTDLGRKIVACQLSYLKPAILTRLLTLYQISGWGRESMESVEQTFQFQKCIFSFCVP